VLKDLRALGLPAERLVANLVHEAIGPLCEFFDRLVETEYPIGCIGYSYCFESIAALKRGEEVTALTALWPKGIDAGRFRDLYRRLGRDGYDRAKLDYYHGMYGAVTETAATHFIVK